MTLRCAAYCLLAAALAACASLDDEEREVSFPRGAAVECERPAPRPALAAQSPGGMSSKFRRLGPRRALELARLAGGVYLEIRHAACGPESQTFKFFLPKAEPAPGDAVSAYARAAELMRGLAAEGKEGDALRELARPLAAAAKGVAAPPLGTLLPLGEFQELTVSVGRVDQSAVYGSSLSVSYRLKL
ncbi:MAG: hypothetical protein HYV15_07475 [Elusimicrobia bacterium]|nr:hypothetical protein [Elusimicrobiota bacterium]